MTKPNLLKELEITEISLVDSGANEGAKVMLWKRGISKAVPDPSNMLGINLLRVLSNRVNNLKREKDISRFEAWAEILQSPEGQQLIEFIAKAKRDPSFIFKDMESRDVSELADFLEGPDADAFIKAFKKQIKKGSVVQKEMEVVEKIKKKLFESQIEAVNSLKLELTKRAAAGDKRTAEKRIVEYLDTHPDLESAILELPDVVKAEVQEYPDRGPTYEVIKKKAKELVSKGLVTSEAKAFCKVVDADPELWVQYLKEQV